MDSWLFQPTSPYSEPSWSPAFTRRSTFDIIIPCTLTLLLCSWTAVHPDIPPKDKEHKWKWMRLKCAVHALLAPEGLLKMAMEEYWESRCIHNKLPELPKPSDLESGEQRVSVGNPTPPDPDANRGSIAKKAVQLWRPIGGFFSHIVCKSWESAFPPGLERGFFIEMGGFELVSTLDKLKCPDYLRGRVTPEGAIALHGAEILPDVPLDRINDLSKTDMIAKLLVCIQVSWMIIQCCARVAQSLPLSLLEVHTVIHTIIAFFMYCLWLKKPHNVKFPTPIIVDEKMLNILKKEGIADRCKDKIKPLKLTETAGANFGVVDRGSGRLSDREEDCEEDREDSWTRLLKRLKSLPAYLMALIYGGLHLTAWKGHFPSHLERILWIASALSIIGWIPFFRLSNFLSETVLQWVTDKFTKKGSEPSNSQAPENNSQPHTNEKSIPEVSENNSQPHTNEKSIPEVSESDSQPPNDESIADAPVNDYRLHQWVPLEDKTKWGWYIIYLVLFLIGEILFWGFTAARYYVIVESFASLRNLPLGAYRTISWVAFIPHL